MAIDTPSTSKALSRTHTHPICGRCQSNGDVPHDRGGARAGMEVRDDVTMSLELPFISSPISYRLHAVHERQVGWAGINTTPAFLAIHQVHLHGVLITPIFDQLVEFCRLQSHQTDSHAAPHDMQAVVGASLVSLWTRANIPLVPLVTGVWSSKKANPIIGPPEMNFSGCSVVPPHKASKSATLVPIGARTFLALAIASPLMVTTRSMRGLRKATAS